PSRSSKPPVRRQRRASVATPPASSSEPTPVPASPRESTPVPAAPREAKPAPPLPREPARPPRVPSTQLTTTQRELLSCLLGGLNDQQIADHLKILKSEVQRETRVLMSTVGVSSERDL